MSDMNAILFDTAARLFEGRAGEDVARASRCGVLTKGAWAAVEEAGLPLALLAEDQGGFGLAPADALELLRISGGFAAPLPLAETMIANWLLAAAGLPLAEGAATFALAPEGTLRRDGEGWTLAAELFHVPWAGQVSTLVVVSGGQVVRIGRDQMTIGSALPEGDLPRADVSMAIGLPIGNVALLPSDIDAERVRTLAALARSLEMAGALRAVLEIAVGYANERVQFGRPLGKFQAIQQQLALLAGEVAAANAAADLAAEAFDGGQEMLTTAVAKARVGEAAGMVSAIAHQVLGAIGFTEEHRLHLYTRALWMWRDEYGSERHWQQRLGEAALAEGGDGFWPFITQPALSGGLAA